ncbi:MAG TPA: BlaI/MecI/CopY family transcriptional regulator [Gemmatimonadaceae bacterium]|nr:BlaI/MecI/CopY family transcriptional regulator [Gemmatimonadaceae bacterium]
MILGDLEQRVIDAAWKLKRPSTARELHEVVSRRHDVAYITAVTVANRLVDKGLMRREKLDQVFHYSPTLSREDFLLHASRHVVRRILGLGTRAVTNSLVDALAQHDPDQLAELGRLVRKKLKEP